MQEPASANYPSAVSSCSARVQRRLLPAAALLCGGRRNAVRLQRFNALQVDPDHICVSAGAGSVIDILFHCIASRGDGALIPVPYYPAFDNDLQVGLGVVGVCGCGGCGCGGCAGWWVCWMVGVLGCWVAGAAEQRRDRGS